MTYLNNKSTFHRRHRHKAVDTRHCELKESSNNVYSGTLN